MTETEETARGRALMLEAALRKILKQSTDKTARQIARLALEELTMTAGQIAARRKAEEK